MPRGERSAEPCARRRNLSARHASLFSRAERGAARERRGAPSLRRQTPTGADRSRAAAGSRPAQPRSPRAAPRPPSSSPPPRLAHRRPPSRASGLRPTSLKAPLSRPALAASAAAASLASAAARLEQRRTSCGARVDTRKTTRTHRTPREMAWPACRIPDAWQSSRPWGGRSTAPDPSKQVPTGGQGEKVPRRFRARHAGQHSRAPPPSKPRERGTLNETSPSSRWKGCLREGVREGLRRKGRLLEGSRPPCAGAPRRPLSSVVPQHDSVPHLSPEMTRDHPRWPRTTRDARARGGVPHPQRAGRQGEAASHQREEQASQLAAEHPPTGRFQERSRKGPRMRASFRRSIRLQEGSRKGPGRVREGEPACGGASAARAAGRRRAPGGKGASLAGR